MTDIPSGSKRSYEADREGDWKRRRGDDPSSSASRDWRDVHLRTDSHRERDVVRDRDRDRDRRSRGGYRKGDDHHRRDDRDRGRNGDRRKHHLRGSHGQRDDRGVSHRPYSNGVSKSRGSDKEEGEISPRRSPLRDHSHAPSSRTSTPRRVESESDLMNSTPRSEAVHERPAEPEPELELVVPEEEPSLEAQIAARRAKRAAILAKYSAGATPATPSTPNVSDAPDRNGTPSASVQPLIRDLTIEDNTVSQAHSPAVNQAAAPAGSRSASPAAHTNGTSAFSLAKEGAEEDSAAQVDTRVLGEGEQISAADYDPSLDRREDEERRVRGMAVKVEPEGDDMEVIEEDEDEDEDVDDMFAIVTANPTKKKKVKVATSVPKPVIATATLDSAADPEGYYQIILGEQLDGGKYQVFSSLGKGMFSNVVRARILNSDGGDVGKEVAIKIVRAQESMHKAGLKEVQILNKLRQSDPEDKKHIVRLERTFEHRGHLCLVFESLSMNLRDVIKRFGKDVGLNIRAVRAYTTQLFLGLGLMRKCNIMHADIKPDNILVSENKTVLKICDLGSASDISENEITPYLVSRFYRAPEIILGLPYDAALDVWSIGCTLYELYTGKILFPGRSNNQMLLLMMELKGRFNSKMIKKAKFGDIYFDEMGVFQSLEKDKVTGGDVTRTVHISKPARDLRARLMPSSSAKLKDDEAKMVLSFIDLLDKCLALDPARRITPKDALMHPFVRGL